MDQIKDILPVIAVVISATGCLLGIYRVVRSAEDKIDKKLERVEENFDGKISTIWRRFDERKQAVDIQVEKVKGVSEKAYLKKEVYESNHLHLQEIMSAQFNALTKLLDERLKNITQSIDDMKNCRVQNERQ